MKELNIADLSDDRPMGQQQGRELAPAVPTTRAGHAQVRRMKTLQQFASTHAALHNHFNQERHLISRQDYKQRRSAAPAEWRQIAA
jgi:putative transposase